ncbi:MAG: hypothetical protein NTY07_15475 [Bacteroidia bacterium]|nr:hypothetical protein [Bacteroidia bacterium]
MRSNNNKKSDFIYTILKILLFVGVIITIFLLSLFVGEFVKHPFPNEISKWYEFAGYVSGIFGTFLTFVNVFVLYKFSKVGEFFNEINLVTQIKSSTFNSFIEILRNGVDQLNYELAHTRNHNEITFILQSLELYLDNFTFEIEDLIHENEEKIIKEKCDDLKDKLTTLRMAFQSDTSSNLRHISEFYTSRAILIRTLRGYLLK